METIKTVKYEYEYPNGVGFTGAEILVSAVVAESITNTGETTVSLITAQTDEFTQRITVNPEAGEPESAIAVKLKGIEETIMQRAIITETLNGEDSVYVIITTTVYRKDISGNVLSVSTFCSATKDGETIAVPSGYGGAVYMPTEPTIINYVYTDYGNTVSVQSVYIKSDETADAYYITFVSDETLIIFIDAVSEYYALYINGEQKFAGDAAEIPAS